MHGAREWNTDERPIVILLLSVHLLTVVLAQMRLRQTLVHLLKDVPFGALFRADKPNHEAPFNAEAQHALNVRPDHLEVHQADQAVLEQIRRHLVDMLALVLELLLQGDQFARLSLPGGSVVDKGLGKDAELSAGFDHVVDLGLVHDRVVHLVVLAILDPRLPQPRYNGARHALLLVLL